MSVCICRHRPGEILEFSSSNEIVYCPKCQLPLPSEVVTKLTILEEAYQLVYGDRHQKYGPPQDDFARIAKFWTEILNVHVFPWQVGLCMIAVKLSREHFKHQRDNLTDIAGYAETVQQIHESRGD